MDDKPYSTNNATELNSYADIAQAVARDPSGIGFTGIQSFPGVKVVAVGGVEANAETVKSGKYPYTRALHFFMNKGKANPQAIEFVKFVSSDHGQGVLAQMGFVPRP